MHLQAVIADWLNHDWVEDWLLPGVIMAVLAIVAWYADRRRMRRTTPDAVGLMPWRDISFWAMFAALLLIAAALRGWLKAV